MNTPDKIYLHETIDAILYDMRKLSCLVENGVDHYRRKDEISSLPQLFCANALKYKKRVLDGYYRILSFPTD